MHNGFFNAPAFWVCLFYAVFQLIFIAWLTH